MIRVYSRESGGKILKETLSCNKKFEIIGEAETGETIHSIGGTYFIQIVVRDLTDCTIVHKDSLEGNLTDKPWDEPILLYAFLIPEQDLTKENHVYEVLAYLSVGVRNPNVSFTKSPMFIICKP